MTSYAIFVYDFFFFFYNFNYVLEKVEAQFQWMRSFFCNLQMIEGEKTEVPVSIGKEGSKEDKDTAAMETDDAQNNGTSAACDNADVNMQDAKSVAGHATAGTPGAENGFS